jgi:hypothetical protein
MGHVLRTWGSGVKDLGLQVEGQRGGRGCRQSARQGTPAVSGKEAKSWASFSSLSLNPTPRSPLSHLSLLHLVEVLHHGNDPVGHLSFVQVPPAGTVQTPRSGQRKGGRGQLRENASERRWGSVLLVAVWEGHR